MLFLYVDLKRAALPWQAATVLVALPARGKRRGAADGYTDVSIGGEREKPQQCRKKSGKGAGVLEVFCTV